MARMSRRTFLSRSAASVLAVSGGVLLSACGRRDAGGGTLRVYNWSEYIYKKVVQDFEKKYKRYDVRVQVSTYGNMDEAVAKLRGGQGRLRHPVPDLRLPRQAGQ